MRWLVLREVRQVLHSSWHLRLAFSLHLVDSCERDRGDTWCKGGTWILLSLHGASLRSYAIFAGCSVQLVVMVTDLLTSGSPSWSSWLASFSVLELSGHSHSEMLGLVVPSWLWENSHIPPLLHRGVVLNILPSIGEVDMKSSTLVVDVTKHNFTVCRNCLLTRTEHNAAVISSLGIVTGYSGVSLDFLITKAAHWILCWSSTSRKRLKSNAAPRVLWHQSLCAL